MHLGVPLIVRSHGELGVHIMVLLSDKINT